MQFPETRQSRILTGLLIGAVLFSGIVLSQNGEDGTDEPEAPDTGNTDNTGPMTAERLGELILNVDEDAMLDGSSWYFTVVDLDAVMIFDVNADRMRIVIPIGKADELEEDQLLRLMQANFDSALDARYAIGQGLLWATYIHPLSTLSDEEFLVGLGQTANVVVTFGTSYSSGLFMYNGGDSAEIEQRKLIEELKKKRKT